MNHKFLLGLGLFSLSLIGIAHAQSGLRIPVGAPQPAELALVRAEQPIAGLPDNIQALIAETKAPTANLSVYVRDLSADKPLVVHNVSVPRNPASTMKLLTTWAGLKLLGPNWTWKTQVWIRGQVQDGILLGDLILKGYGDPFLTDESFWQLLHDLRLKGLREIHGNLVVDNSYFDLSNEPATNFDDEPTKIYNALPSALMFNFQGTRFLFEADDFNKRVNIISFPQNPRLNIENNVSYVSGGCQKIHYLPKFVITQNNAKVSGSYSSGCGKNFIMRLASASPEEHVFNAFRDVWQSQGGTLTGGLKTGVVQAGDVLVHTLESRTLGEQIRFINKYSNNVMARELLLSIGGKIGGEPATPSKGAQAVLQLLADEGINTTGLVIDNGAGLSRNERVSALQLGKLLETAWRDPYMPEFMASMPLLGEDGTLAHRFHRDDMKGRSHLKTGTLKDVTAIAGYMLTRSGKRMVIVIQHNGAEASGSGRLIQDAILRWVFEQ